MKRKSLKAESPADALFENMPEHVKTVYRKAKSLKREKERKQYMDLLTGRDGN